MDINTTIHGMLVRWCARSVDRTGNAEAGGFNVGCGRVRVCQKLFRQRAEIGKSNVRYERMRWRLAEPRLWHRPMKVFVPPMSRPAAVAFDCKS